MTKIRCQYLCILLQQISSSVEGNKSADRWSASFHNFRHSIGRTKSGTCSWRGGRQKMLRTAKSFARNLERQGQRNLSHEGLHQRDEGKRRGICRRCRFFTCIFSRDAGRSSLAVTVWSKNLYLGFSCNLELRHVERSYFSLIFLAAERNRIFSGNLSL